MTETVFYSWQSDLPDSTNLDFIEDAITEAIESISSVVLEKANRQERPQLDRDTVGVPGTPPIVDIIFDKISKATVFIADLSIISKTRAGRAVPNPNVLIEHGWALAKLGHSRMVPVMNEAFGRAEDASLPFDLRHLRRPLTYFLSEKATEKELASAKFELVESLAQQIELVLRTHRPTNDEKATISQIQSTTDPSMFLASGEPLATIKGGSGDDLDLIIPNNEHLFLRLIPLTPTSSIHSATKARDLLGRLSLRPLSELLDGWDMARNKLGAFTYRAVESRVIALTQLFLNKELWGINSFVLDKENLKGKTGGRFAFFPSEALERTYLNTLPKYLEFYKNVLEIEPPIKFVAGATGVQGYRMTPRGNRFFGGFERFAGQAVDQHIVHSSIITSYDIAPESILQPYFEGIWDSCGLQYDN